MKHAAWPTGFAMRANAVVPVGRRVRSLLAAFIALGMTASLAITPSLTSTASAADDGASNSAGNSNAAVTPGVCSGKTIQWGGADIGSSTVDDGIATYVGGDMYVGKNTGGTMNDANGPEGSYAVEAEGLTAVKGKLLMHPLKTSWTVWKDNDQGLSDARGFRFGTVGFGAQFRPAENESVLDVYGQSNNESLNWVGGAQAWGNAGWIGKLSSESSLKYTANIANNGTPTTLYEGTANDFLGYPGLSQNTDKNRWDTRQSVYVPSDATSTVNWNKSASDTNIGNTDEVFVTTSTTDSFGDKIVNMSQNLKSLGEQGSVDGVYVGQGEFLSSDNDTYKSTDAFDRNKFISKTGDTPNYTYHISNTTETIIRFRGDGTSALQVFNLDSNELDADTSYSYAFENIPDTASVAINVTGANAQTLSYHNGWRFWWTEVNGDPKKDAKEIGGSFNDEAYMKRAQQVLWNFPDTTNLTIMGGQATGKIGINFTLSTNAHKDGVWGEMKETTTTAEVTTTDDPAAGLLGSVLVPNGNFESHVSTNGRVWIGGDFSMYNPTPVSDVNGSLFVNSERSHSASALDMDQERHNVPWNGAYTAQCATLAWDKVDDSASHNALAGTTWAVYGSLEDAKENNLPKALKKVTDGEYGDEDKQSNGSFEVGGLNPSENGTTLTYYLREVSANNAGYRTNSNIYAIAAGKEGSVSHTIAAVYDSNGALITDDGKKLLIASGSENDNDKIINERKGLELDWSKVDKDATGKKLAGAAWYLKKNGSNVAYHITDTTMSVAKVTIKRNGEAVTKITLDTTDIADLVAEVTGTNGSTSGVPQTVTWVSSNPGFATVDDSGLVTPISVGETTIKACSMADDAKCASVTVTVVNPPSQIATTTVYYPTSVFGASVLPNFQYLLDGETKWVTAQQMETAECDGWVKYTFENPNKKGFTFDVYSGKVWDNGGGSGTDYKHVYAAEITLSGSVNKGSSITPGTLSTGAPVGCSAIPAEETTTTVYYPTSVFGTNVLPNFQYLLDGETKWVSGLQMEAAECDGWLKYTFKNPDRKGFQFDVYYNNAWDNNNRNANNYHYSYSAELTLSGSSKSGDKVTAGTLSSGVPASCIVTPPSTEETVLINDHASGDTIILAQGKTLTLTATKTPSSATLTWSSGNTSVATVTADSSDDTKATIKAVAIGSATVRVRTGNGTITKIKIKVANTSTLRVYFNTSAVKSSWTNGYWLAYQQKSNGIYTTVKMETAACNSNYVVADIPIDQVQDGYGYYFRDNERLDSKRQWYGSNGTQSTGEPFQFPSGSYSVLTVEDKSTRKTSAPTGCETNTNATNTKSAKSAVHRLTSKVERLTSATGTAKSVAKNVGIAVNAADSSSAVTAANETVYSCSDALGKCDMDTSVGGFRIVDLEAGTYTLTETVAPNGYVETVETYTVTLASDGTVTWDPANVSDNKVTNTRMRGTVAWRKVAAADDATSGSAGGSGTDSGTGGSAGDAGPGVALGGSEWALTKLTSFAWSADGKATYPAITGGDAAAVTITDCVDGQNGVNDCSAQTPTESNPYPDLDGAAGRFAIAGLDWGEYALKESKAPEGYTVESTGRTFTFGPKEGGNTTGQWYRNSVGSGGIVSAEAVDYDQAVFDFDIGDITNTRTLGSVTWTKVGSDDTSTPLAGSAWKLTRTHRYDAETGGYVQLASAEEFNVIDCTSSPCPSGAGSAGNTWNDSDSAVGKFKLDQLPWGKYSLVETTAPRGYTPQAKGTSFTIGPASVGSADASQQETSQTGLSIQLGEIVNQKTVIATAIPMTGGDWTGRTILAVGGGLAVLAGICAIACKAIRRRTITHA
ncbi:Ig-like domain-containing protein [Bifidobacterium sp. 64T4]|uniref:SpaA isopeptide-forming pilin-related protein n=1 Tax=Bifidobacterium pongonis TaxID=2834432 RepID=UPI001C57F1AA|nr:SpaA isopeptide-forming pilin-related protein [Bifidobacterium pongonis]MBW3094278.1 Ig-like domain-containing protein [Bifidobacterium pongonis]